MFTCEFCNKEFTMKGNMISHQKTTKYCLEKQGKNLSENFKCEYCDRIFTLKTNLNDHISICKEKQKKQVEDNKTKEYENEIQEIKKEYENEIKKKDKEIKKIKEEHEKELSNYKREHKEEIGKFQTEINLLNKNIEKLESKLESYERRLFEMASSKTNMTNSNNKTLLMNVINNTNLPITNEVLRQCATTFTINHAKNINGITKHLTESLEDHITCTDQARNIFKYTNEKEQEIIDTDLENLLPQYLTALKDENNFLYKEVVRYFKENNVSINEQTDYNIFYNALNAIIERKGDQNKYSERMKKQIVRECKKQFLEKNKNKEKEITKELTDEEIMMNIIRSGGSVYDFVCRVFDVDDIDNETDEQFNYRRKMEDLFKQKKKEWRESKEKI
jgi:muconolactone delta-isomerase